MSVVHSIRIQMEKNKYLARFVPSIQNISFVRYRRDVILARVDDKNKQPFQVCYAEHQDEFEKLAEMLADDFSRKTLRAVINYRLNPAVGKLGGVIVEPQYFLPEIFGPVENEVFIDGGAYTGDTILSLIKEFGKGKDYYRKIYAWEPDNANCEMLRQNCKGYGNIKILPYGMWSEKTELPFVAGGTTLSHISAEGTQTLPVDTIDNLCKDEKITFIKMDIEGSELEALHGAEHIIRRDKPRLAICIYHKPEHFYQIPFLIREMVPEYKLYIRQHTPHYNETVLYAVAENPTP